MSVVYIEFCYVDIILFRVFKVIILVEFFVIVGGGEVWIWENRIMGGIVMMFGRGY